MHTALQLAANVLAEDYAKTRPTESLVLGIVCVAATLLGLYGLLKLASRRRK